MVFTLKVISAGRACPGEKTDAAHKAAADASDTDRFVLIDGDNIPDPEFFNLQLELNNTNSDKAIAKIKRFSMGFILGDHNLTYQKTDGNAIF